MKLPPACPGMGYGTSMKAAYAGSGDVLLKCWSCERFLPEVKAAICSIEDEGGYHGRVRPGPLYPIDLRVDDYQLVVAAALRNEIGLCPRCYRGVFGRPRPKPIKGSR